MEFGWSGDEREFREDVRSVIRDHMPVGWSQEDKDLPTEVQSAQCIAFCGALAERGLLTPHWPIEYGGREASPWERTILGEEMWGAGEPRGPQYMNVNWIGPAIMAAGTPEQKQYHLGRIARGDVLWCQGFSEVDAGSDMASLRTAAVRDGDVYVVNGQKVWTSYAHAAEFCFLLVRTDPAAEKHLGITILLCPMDTPGIEVREIPTPFQPHLLHEVFFADVQVPVSCRLGDENRGWEIVRNVLANERIGVARHEYAVNTLDRTLEAATDGGRIELDPTKSIAAGLAYATAEATRSLNYAAADERDSGKDGTRGGSYMARVAVGILEPSVNRACHEMLGPVALTEDSPAAFQLPNAITAPIAAGTLEIQLNLVARVVLGLPKEGAAR